jgi:5-methylthioadenosine/S-adenosylhomocysteine deaminase
MDAERATTMKADALRSLDALEDTGDRVAASLGPHAIYTVSEPSLRWVAEISADRSLPVHIHCSETEDEVTNCVAAHGVRPAPYLDGLGLLTPRTVLAHGVWLDDDELALVGERGATVVTNPVSNLKLAVGGVFPYESARAHGVPVGLGTDGAASNNSLDLLQDMKHLALMQKHVARDPAAMPASEAWAVATGARAPLLGQSGRLDPGDPADFVLVQVDRPELVPGDLTANLVYAASGLAVDTTVVAGQVLMRGGEIDGVDEVRAKAVESARRLGIVS